MRIPVLATVACLLTAAVAPAQTPAPADLPPNPEAAAVFDRIPAGVWSMDGPRVWAQADYMLMWISTMNTPDLIQAVPTNVAVESIRTGTALPAGAAQRFFPATQQLEFGSFNGLRATTGVNFARFGVEASGFYLDKKTKTGELFNDGRPQTAAVGYNQAATGTPISLFASLAGEYSGGVRASVESQLWGGEANVRLPWFTFVSNTDALVGGRYVKLQESIDVNYRANFPDGTSLNVRDSVLTRNEFYGGQVGLDSRIGGDQTGLGMDVITKLGLGNMRQRAELTGTNSFLTPGAPADTETAGLFARPADQGVFTRDKFAAVIEFNANLTYNFTPGVQVYFGYSLLYLSSVQRPGEAIDTTINDARVRFISNPPPGNLNRPAFSWNANDFTAQGITFGARLQY